MATSPGPVLVVNCGSSSVKMAIVDPTTGQRSLSALVERLGGTAATAVVRTADGERRLPCRDGSHRTAVAAVLEVLPDQPAVLAVGHRIVHGGHRYADSVLVDDDVVSGLTDITTMAPLHLPASLSGILAVSEVRPDLPQAAVFDTGFHRTLPPPAYRYAIPDRWFTDHGARRFGFHGISVRHVIGRTAQLLGRPLVDLKLVVAHLGNGCSATAVRGGVSVDTTMGFTPLEGLVMGTRSGDVDPGLLAYLGPRLGLDLDGLVSELNNSSGLAGVSGAGSDARKVIDQAHRGNDRALLALQLFAYRLAKAVAALTVPLEGLDALVFTAGIGEHSTDIRAMTLQHLAHLGLHLDPDANADNGARTGGRVTRPGPPVALVVPTDEELVIARDTVGLIDTAG